MTAAPTTLRSVAGMVVTVLPITTEDCVTGMEVTALNSIRSIQIVILTFQALLVMVTAILLNHTTQRSASGIVATALGGT